MQQPTLSPDGRYRWNGQQWVPNEQPPAPPAAAPRRRRRWPWIAALVTVLLVGVCSVATMSSSSGKSTSTAARSTTAVPVQPAATQAAKATAPARDGSCAPQPCANDNYGWIVTVSNVKYDAASGNEFETPETGNVYVTMNVSFTNKLSQEEHANPTEFVLLDGAGVKHTVTFTDACPLWDAVNLTSGASLGPKCLAFEATAGKPTGLTLVWTPSALGGDYDIKLS
jgi:hypothetical protein